jgi:hypothetical protein
MIIVETTQIAKSALNEAIFSTLLRNTLSALSVTRILHLLPWLLYRPTNACQLHKTPSPAHRITTLHTHAWLMTLLTVCSLASGVTVMDVVRRKNFYPVSKHATLDDGKLAHCTSLLLAPPPCTERVS